MGKGERNRAQRVVRNFGPSVSVRERRARVADGVDVAYSRLGHAKAKRPVPGRCWLCTQETELELSHVIPRWAYREWAGSGGGIALNWNRTEASPAQDGAKFYLLCGTCERRLGAGEGLLRRIHHDEESTWASHGLVLGRDQAGLPQIQGANRDVLHRGLLGIAFKILVSHTDATRKRSAVHLDRLRHALLKDDYSAVQAPLGLHLVGHVDSAHEGHDRVVFGATTVAARFTIGKIHWFVPMARQVSKSRQLSWSLLEHQVSSDDVLGQLWVEGSDLDLAGLAAQALPDA